ncbi:MAG TPA: UvrB/UvrC motif-containing protein [Kiritimatiellia bacterium]|nr:UvrB/UvrC motif-containing protein [Kiritimatiellia bacterium]
MSKDIGRIVSGWPYDPNEVSARWIQADDGTRQIQLRLDLGVFQMALEGRPDGTQPRGFPSLLDFYLEEEVRSPGKLLPYRLDSDACAELQQEVMQYYYRIMAYHALGHLPGVIADCDHNLDLIDIVSDYAQDDEVAWQFMQLYPYMRMMQVRAQAELDMQAGRFAEAAAAAREAIGGLESFYTENFEPTNEDGSPVPPPPELESVRELLDQVERRRPRSQAEALQEELARAVELENYEKAAFLRDQLKTITGVGPRGAGKKRIRPEGRGNTN